MEWWRVSYPQVRHESKRTQSKRRVGTKAQRKSLQKATEAPSSKMSDVLLTDKSIKKNLQHHLKLAHTRSIIPPPVCSKCQHVHQHPHKPQL